MIAAEQYELLRCSFSGDQTPRGAHIRSRFGGRGVTLIELLVVIALMAILLSLLIPAAARCRFLSRQARELSAAQQLMVAYTLYADDSRGMVMPGYPTAALVAGPLIVMNDRGERIMGEKAQRYPWRLAPHLGFNFRGLYKDDRLLEEIRANQATYLPMGVDYDYVVSLFPSLGLNVGFVGGSVQMLGFNPDALRLFGRFYTVRIADVVRPTRLLVFASARESEQPHFPQIGRPEGFFRVEPPYFTARRWQATYDPDAPYPGLNSGFVSLRHGGRAVTAMIDGHAEALGWDDLQDMTRWADGASRADWVLTPR